MHDTGSTPQVGGVPISILDFTTAVREICSEGSSGRSVHFANAKTIVDANEDSGYRTLLREAWLVLPDGAPVARLAARAGRRKPQRICGPDVFEAVISLPGVRNFLIAPNQHVVQEITMKDNVLIVGSVVPGFLRHWEFPVQEFADSILASEATHVWVGVGSPKQDFLAAELAKVTPATVLAVGAAMEFTAGLTARAPRLLRDAGLEWLHRLSKHPKRLWRRYLIGNIRFIWIVCRRKP